MNRRIIKKNIFLLLENESWSVIEPALFTYSPQAIIHPLFSALCSPKELCRWHAISAFGAVVPKIADAELEEGRIIMRRFLWSLNDESGGIGWGVPEAMGEVMTQCEILFIEYGQLLVSYMREDGPELFQDGNYLELPALQRGLLWAVGRLLSKRKEVMMRMGVVVDLQKYLYSKDRIVRALAAFCLGKCCDSQHLKYIEELTNDHFAFNLYWENKLQETTVASLAKRAIKEISSH